MLAAVLDDAYGPARARHAGFMRGGGACKKVLDAVPPRGSLSAADKEEVAFLVRSWAWRRERRQEMGVGVEYPRDKLYPPAPSEPEEGEGHGRLVGGSVVRVSVLCALFICCPGCGPGGSLGRLGRGGPPAHGCIIRRRMTTRIVRSRRSRTAIPRYLLHSTAIFSTMCLTVNTAQPLPQSESEAPPSSFAPTEHDTDVSVSPFNMD